MQIYVAPLEKPVNQREIQDFLQDRSVVLVSYYWRFRVFRV